MIIFYISQWTIPSFIVENKSHKRFFKPEEIFFFFLIYFELRIFLIPIRRIRSFINRSFFLFISCPFKV
ncbi:hypothetical protein AJ87_01045 [Rhizobium yanglingense]|nr:hypothetical protein AJ87_01045 [Rhizobium yanglingense]